MWKCLPRIWTVLWPHFEKHVLNDKDICQSPITWYEQEFHYFANLPSLEWWHQVCIMEHIHNLKRVKTWKVATNQWTDTMAANHHEKKLWKQLWKRIGNVKPLPLATLEQHTGLLVKHKRIKCNVITKAEATEASNWSKQATEANYQITLSPNHQMQLKQACRRFFIFCQL